MNRLLLCRLGGVFVAGMCVAVPRPTLADGVWTELEQLPYEAVDRSGGMISGDTAVFGLRYDDTQGTDAGAMWVFEHDGVSLGTPVTLFASDATENAQYGFSASIDGDIVVVGAPGGAGLAGAAYVYERVAGDWIERSVLSAPTPVAGDQFGFDVTVDGDTVVVSAISSTVADGGTVSVFERTGDAWLLSTEFGGTGADPSARFGWSVALDGDTLAVGAHRLSGITVTNSGGLYVYDRDGGNWTETFSFFPDVAARLGRSVAVDGDTIAIGGPNLASKLGGNTGIVYVFVDDGGWQQQAAIQAPELASPAWFGREVDVQGDRLLISEPNREGAAGTFQGAIHDFRRADGVWTANDMLVASNAQQQGFFGDRVSLDGEFAIAASRSFVGPASVYLLRLLMTGGDSCTTADECVSGFCVDGVCCDNACGDGDSSDCQACSVAQGAFEDGVCAPIVAGTVCRASTELCDIEEVCDGTATACPSDERAADETPCDDGDRCTVGDACQRGVCMPGGDECGGTQGTGSTTDTTESGDSGLDGTSGGSDPEPGGSSSDSGSPMTSDGGSTEASGGDDGNTDLDDDGSFVNCECRASGRGGPPASALLIAVLLGLRRRRR